MDAFDGLNEFTVEGKAFRLLEDTYSPGCQYVDASDKIVTVWQQRNEDGLVAGVYDYSAYMGDPNNLDNDLFIETGFTDYRVCAVAGLRAVGL